MKVINEKTENRQAFLTVEMDDGDMKPAIDAAFSRLAKKTTIPGFRKGKAPRQILERYVGHGKVLEEAIDYILPQAYEQALKEVDIEPYAQPELEITQVEPLAFKATVPLKPIVELGKYKDIRIEPIKIEITEKNIEDVISELRHKMATWEPVEHPLEYNNLAVLDITGTIDDKPYIKKIGAQTQILEGSEIPVPGFAEQVIGMKQGEEREFTLTIPEDYPDNDVAGKEIHFSVKLEDVKEEKLPEINEEFIASVSSESKNLDELREEIKKSLEVKAEDQIRIDHEERVINAIIADSKVEYPPILVELEIDRILKEQERQLSASGKGMEDYLQRIGKTEEQLRKELEPIARKNITASLVLSEIAEIESITVTGEDIDHAIDKMCQNITEDQRDMFRAIIDTPKTRESLNSSLKTRKTIELLTGIAKTEDDKPKTIEKNENGEFEINTDTKEEQK